MNRSSRKDKFAGTGFKFIDVEEIRLNDTPLDFDRCAELAGNLSTHTVDENMYDIHVCRTTQRVQQYIKNPILSKESTKNSLRSYMLILSVAPAVVLFHEGMVYRSLVEYADWQMTDSGHGDGATGLSRMAHITNIQSNHPQWSKRKHDGLQS